MHVELGKGRYFWTVRRGLFATLPHGCGVLG
jgi:hypothetical protein